MEDLVKQISQRARERKEQPDTSMVVSGEARKSAVRKMMEALKNEDDERFLQAYEELKITEEE